MKSIKKKKSSLCRLTSLNLVFRILSILCRPSITAEEKCTLGTARFSFLFLCHLYIFYVIFRKKDRKIVWNHGIVLLIDVRRTESANQCWPMKEPKILYIAFSYLLSLYSTCDRSIIMKYIQSIVIKIRILFVIHILYPQIEWLKGYE